MSKNSDQSINVEINGNRRNVMLTDENSSEFSSYEIEFRNQVKQNDVTLRVNNSKMFIEILLSSYQLDSTKY